MKKIIFTLLLAVIGLSSCNSSKDLAAAYNMTKCKFGYNSVSALNVGGMDLSSGFSLAQLPKITSLISGNNSSIPVNFNLNVDVNNPNESVAMLHGLQYMISIDGIDFTTGAIDNSLSIAAGENKIVPINIGVDLATLLSENSKDAVMDIARNIIGIGTKTSTVTLKVRPTFMVKNTPITSPAYIPINFTFGGKGNK